MDLEIRHEPIVHFNMGQCGGDLVPVFGVL